MRYALKRHPDSPCAAVTRVEVDAVRAQPGTLELCYLVTGKVSDLRMPAVTAPDRSHELWRHTCFEAFVRASSGTAYYEFNFAPSTRWAAYAFSGYRSGMRVASEVSAPRFDLKSHDEGLRLEVSIELDRLPDLPIDGDWILGLSAVIEEISGCKSYWALAHPPGAADFHHSDCFAHELS